MTWLSILVCCEAESLGPSDEASESGAWDLPQRNISMDVELVV